jgi:thymidylate synthase (FAD)
MVLPQSTMTEWWWSGTVGAWAKMCNLRCKPDTQLETRIVADKISDKMGELFPVSWSALKGY